jgi:hypothetical protein
LFVVAPTPQDGRHRRRGNDEGRTDELQPRATGLTAAGANRASGWCRALPGSVEPALRVVEVRATSSPFSSYSVMCVPSDLLVHVRALARRVVDLDPLSALFVPVVVVVEPSVASDDAVTVGLVRASGRVLTQGPPALGGGTGTRPEHSTAAASIGPLDDSRRSRGGENSRRPQKGHH